MPNYKNDVFIIIVKRLLPHGLEAWREVALAYQRETHELTLHRGEGLQDNWNKKLCNQMQKPTGKPGVLSDYIFHCIAIKCRIQDVANVPILGVDSKESNHSCNDGLSAFLDNDMIAGGVKGAMLFLLVVSASRKRVVPPLNLLS